MDVVDDTTYGDISDEEDDDPIPKELQLEMEKMTLGLLWELGFELEMEKDFVKVRILLK